MPFTLATWNINSVRLREGLVARLMAEEAPDILCLQECKSPVENIPLGQFQALGYRYNDIRNMVSEYNITWRDEYLEKIPLADLFGETIENLAGRIAQNLPRERA